MNPRLIAQIIRTTVEHLKMNVGERPDASASHFSEPARSIIFAFEKLAKSFEIYADNEDKRSHAPDDNAA